MLDAVFPANVVRILGGTGLLFALGCAALASAQESGHTTAGAAASDGEWTTSEQVERGVQLYEQRCSTCHGDAIVSDFASYPNAGLFFGFVSTAMPADAPGSLPHQQYADIIAYLLSANGMPVGSTELPPDQAILSEIKPSELDSGEGEQAP